MAGAVRHGLLFGKKYLRVRAVIANTARDPAWHAVFENVLDRAADADDRCGPAVNLPGQVRAPRGCPSPRFKTRVENVKPVDGDDKWNVQAFGEQECGVTAGQCGVGMNDVDSVALMKCPNER